MLEISLQELFGRGGIQNNQLLIIQKSDLPGLTSSANNRAEQLLVALLLKAQEQFEGLLIDQDGDIVVDENGEAIRYDNTLLYDFFITYWRTNLIQIHKHLYLNNQFTIFNYAKAD